MATYVWDQRKTGFFKIKFELKILWKYLTDQVLFRSEERYNTEVSFSKVSLQKNKTFFHEVGLINESTPYVWDMAQLTYGTFVFSAQVYSWEWL